MKQKGKKKEAKKEKAILFGKARKAIKLLTALKKSKNVVTILNSKVKRKRGDRDGIMYYEFTRLDEKGRIH